MALSHSRKIVNDGLVLCLDAGDRKSYSGSGSTWVDRSGNGYNGTLTNGPTFDSANGGSLSFDGSNDYVDCGMSSFQPTNMTLCAWIKKDNNGGSSGIIVKGDINETTEWGISFGYSNPYRLVARERQYGNQLTYSWSNELAQNFHYISYVVVGGVSSKLYVDAELVSSDDTVSTIGLNSKNVLLGKWNNYGSSDGLIAVAKIYDKALTAAEVLQNYNAQKGRFS